MTRPAGAFGRFRSDSGDVSMDCGCTWVLSMVTTGYVCALACPEWTQRASECRNLKVSRGNGVPTAHQGGCWASTTADIFKFHADHSSWARRVSMTRMRLRSRHYVSRVHSARPSTCSLYQSLIIAWTKDPLLTYPGMQVMAGTHMVGKTHPFISSASARIRLTTIPRVLRCDRTRAQPICIGSFSLFHMQHVSQGTAT